MRRRTILVVLGVFVFDLIFIFYFFKKQETTPLDIPVKQVTTQPVSVEKAPVQPVILPPLPADTVVDQIVVKKSERVLSLYHGAELIRSYRVSLGKVPVGPKQVEGDGRTPEGNYLISGRNPKSRFHLSLRVSYPSPADLESAKLRGFSPGGDIMIHGAPEGMNLLAQQHMLGDWTAGCVALTNEEIEEIYRVVRDGTPIKIVP